MAIPHRRLLSSATITCAYPSDLGTNSCNARNKRRSRLLSAESLRPGLETNSRLPPSLSLPALSTEQEGMGKRVAGPPHGAASDARSRSSTMKVHSAEALRVRANHGMSRSALSASSRHVRCDEHRRQNKHTGADTHACISISSSRLSGSDAVISCCSAQQRTTGAVRGKCLQPRIFHPFVVRFDMLRPVRVEHSAFR